MVRQMARKTNINKCKTAFYGRDLKIDFKSYLSSTELERVGTIKDLGRRIKFCPALQRKNKQSIGLFYGRFTEEKLHLSDRRGVCYIV